MTLMRLISSITLFALMAPAAFALSGAQNPKPRFNNKHWSKRYQSIATQAHRTHKDILFLGDSITEGWLYTPAWQRHFAKRALNAGISGDSTQHVLWRLQQGLIARTQPRLVVLMIGTNNALNHKPSEVAQAIGDILKKINHDSPSTKVLLLGILPSGAKKTDPRRLANIEVNQVIRGFADKKDTFYSDLGHLFLESDGSINKATMWDHLHLTKRSYNRLAKALDPEIHRILDATGS